MALTKKQKGDILKDIKESLSGAEMIAFVNFHGLGVAEVTELRSLLREAGAKYRVIKKTLLKKVLGETKIEGERPKLEGEVAIMTAPTEEVGLVSAKVLHQFAKKNKGMLALLGGVFENKYIDSEKTVALAVIPSKEVLLGQFVNIINSPIQGLAIVLSERVKKMES